MVELLILVKVNQCESNTLLFIFRFKHIYLFYQLKLYGYYWIHTSGQSFHLGGLFILQCDLITFSTCFVCQGEMSTSISMNMTR